MAKLQLNCVANTKDLFMGIILAFKINGVMFSVKFTYQAGRLTSQYVLILQPNAPSLSKRHIRSV